MCYASIVDVKAQRQAEFRINLKCANRNTSLKVYFTMLVVFFDRAVYGVLHTNCQ